MSDELDLSQGDEARAERIAQIKGEGESRQRSRRTSSKSSAKKKPVASDTSLAGQLSDAFDRLAEQRKTVGDDELADALTEGKDAMSNALVAMTRTVTFLRKPLLFFLSILMPILAFWKVGNILARRFAERRQQVMAQRQQAEAGVEQVPVSG